MKFRENLLIDLTQNLRMITKFSMYSHKYANVQVSIRSLYFSVHLSRPARKAVKLSVSSRDSVNINPKVLLLFLVAIWFIQFLKF